VEWTNEKPEKASGTGRAVFVTDRRFLGEVEATGGGNGWKKFGILVRNRMSKLGSSVVLVAVLCQASIKVIAVARLLGKAALFRIVGCRIRLCRSRHIPASMASTSPRPGSLFLSGVSDHKW